MDILTRHLKDSINKKISPKILSTKSNPKYFTDNNASKNLFMLRNLNKFTIETMALKLNITEDEYKNFEKGKKVPNERISLLLMAIFNLNPTLSF